MRSSSFIAVALAVSGCFIPVDVGPADGGTPDPQLQEQTQGLPGVLLVVDRSGSLNEPLDAGDARCTPGCGAGTPCPANCPTRLQALRGGVEAALSANAAQVRFGLVLYPHGNGGCFAADTIDVHPVLGPEPAAPLQLAQRVRSKVMSFVTNGGTPTAATLRFVQAVPPEDARTIVVVSDSTPNCNDQNVNHTCAGANPACRCTLGPLSACQNAGSTAFQPCSHGCLDDDGVTAAAAALAQRGQRVFFVGLGADVQLGETPRVFNAMARSGATGVGCPNGTDGECLGHGVCEASTRLCTESHFVANDAAQLAAALQQIIRQAR